MDIENNDALKVIETRDSPETFFYLDPPYINCNQSHYSGYTEKDFEKLLEALSKIKGKFLLSSYKSPILEKYIQKHKWLTMDIDGHTMVNSKVLKAKTEVLTSNYPIFFFRRCWCYSYLNINKRPASPATYDRLNPLFRVFRRFGWHNPELTNGVKYLWLLLLLTIYASQVAEAENLRGLNKSTQQMQQK